MSILNQILTQKMEEVKRLKDSKSVSRLREEAMASPPPRGFMESLRGCPHVPVIAEIKRASPSAGSIKNLADVGTQATQYETGGAAALSVLTDGPFFKGAIEDLTSARAAVSLPALRKDFMIDPVQLYEARAAGADAVLLIVAALGQPRLEELFAEASSLGMASVVEVHNEEELKRAVDIGPEIIGINNRNLRTMEVSLETSLRLAPMIPEGTMILAESGVKGPEDIARLLQGGVDAFLVGTTLMKAPDPAAELALLCRKRD